MRSREDNLSDYLLGGLFGIMLAGAAFPLVVSVITLGAIVYTNGINGGVGLEQIVEVAAFLFFACCIAAAISVFTGLISILLVWIASMSLGNPLDHRTVAISAGSLAGYAPTIGFVQIEEIAVILPILAACMGAIGASRSAKMQQLLCSRSPPTRQTKYRLTIWRLMAATAWVAVVFAIANLTGSLFFVFAVAGWFVLNTLLIGLAKLYRAFRPDPLLSQ